MKYFDRLFYYIFKNDSRYGGNDYVNAFFSILGIVVLEFLNIVAILFSLKYFIKLDIVFSDRTYYASLSILFLLNLLYFMLNKRFSRIREAFANETESEFAKRNFWCKMYIIVSSASLPLIGIAFIIISRIIN